MERTVNTYAPYRAFTKNDDGELQEIVYGYDCGNGEMRINGKEIVKVYEPCIDRRAGFIHDKNLLPIYARDVLRDDSGTLYAVISGVAGNLFLQQIKRKFVKEKAVITTWDNASKMDIIGCFGDDHTNEIVHKYIYSKPKRT